MTGEAKSSIERHIQTVLLALLTLGVGIVGGMINSLNKAQQQNAIEIAAVTVETAAIKERFVDFTDRAISPADAAAYRIEVARQLADIAASNRELNNRLTAIERRLEGNGH